MKKSITTLLSILIVTMAFAQNYNTQGAVVFEEVMKINIQLDNMTPEMEAMIPKENRNSTILYFNENASRYENYESTGDAVIDEEMEGGSVKIMMSQPENIIYRDLSSNSSVEQTEFMTRVFLIESDNPVGEWKMTGNQKMILDFPCQEAVRKDGERETKVWFTPAIPVSTGPSQFFGLPGLILAMEENDGDRTIIASSVKLEEIDEEKLKKPKKGKKVTKEEFLAIVDEKTKEMGGESGGEGSQTIIMKISQ